MAALLLPFAGAQSYQPAPTPQHASGFISASWTDTAPPLACPCQVIALPLQVENTLGPPVYSSAVLSVEPDLSGSIGSIGQIQAFATKSTQVRLQVSCTAAAGPKLFLVHLDSTSQDGRSSSQDIFAAVNVLECSKLTLSPAQASMVCPQAGVDYAFALSNDGLNNESGTLQVIGVKPSTVTLSQNYFSLLPGQSQIVTVRFIPPFTYIPTQGDSLTLQVKGTDATATASVPLTTVSCPVATNSTTPPVINPSKPKPPAGGNGGSNQLNGFPSLSLAPITGLFTALRSNITATALVLIAVIVLILAYATTRQAGAQSAAQETKSRQSSLERTRRIAYAVQNY